MLESVFCWNDPFEKFPGVRRNLIWRSLKHPAALNTATAWIWTGMATLPVWFIWTATASKNMGRSQSLFSLGQVVFIQSLNNRSWTFTVIIRQPFCNATKPSADRCWRTQRMYYNHQTYHTVLLNMSEMYQIKCPRVDQTWKWLGLPHI